MLQRHHLVLAALALLSVPASAHAFSFEPISRVFDPSGSRATQTFVIHNTSPDRIAIEVTVGTLARDLDYVESSRPADAEFLVVPSQVIVGPGKRQTVRVKWLGDPAPRSERAFRIIVSQLPIELVEPGAPPPATATGHVRVLLNYRGSLWVRPRGAAPKIAVESAAAVVGADGVRRLAIVVRNRGTANGTIAGCRGSLRSPATGAAVLVPGSLDLLKHTRILAGGRRRYLLPWPASMAVTPVTPRIQCDLLL